MQTKSDKIDTNDEENEKNEIKGSVYSFLKN